MIYCSFTFIDGGNRGFIQVNFKGWREELKSEITVDSIDHYTLTVSWTTY